MERCAVVTGANKGIGLQIAKQLLPSVSLLILACRDSGRGEAAAKELGAPAVFEELDLSDGASIDAFAERVEGKYGRLDVLVNNGAVAFKGSDPTPFEEQTGPTLATNFFGTYRLTERLLPLLRRSPEGQIVNVASMAGKLSQLEPHRQKQFTDPGLSKEVLVDLVREFEADVAQGQHADKGWSNSNYGFSKLAVIAYTKILARDAPDTLKVNCCCPGYCATDMSSHKGPRSAADGARNAVMLAQPGISYSGVFIRDEAPAEW
eukprot:CAMPEP_0118919990 /NCGR_PEP_ID=MMETSP1166-20130328/18840_1 /TAXON_ID=1104430 /ORGANISM="Chrysoreinhardia sp, Strain CCMP3193" /LENGTH=262 /DNA_ID=CAMNT_0006860525 /DNA_START=49 /DNA_END=837 /DNA_ORIENTATION=-